MFSRADQERARAQSPPDPLTLLDGRKTYRVVIDDIASGMETSDSFAIKFSLLTRSPLSRMKHVVRRLPATVWSGTGRSQAERVLALIEEAGGKGRIVETGDAPSAAPATGEVQAKGEASAKPAAAPPAGRSCAMCGFPMNDGETRCGFCRTPVGAAGRRGPHGKSAISVRAISRKRLALYGACLVVGLLLFTILVR